MTTQTIDPFFKRLFIVVAIVIALVLLRLMLPVIIPFVCAFVLAYLLIRSCGGYQNMSNVG